jgi:hypothetical protein
VKSLLDDHGQVVHILDQVVVLGAGPGDSGNIRLLEGIVADQHGGDLPGKDHHGNGIHVGRGQSGDGIGAAGAGGYDADADLAGGPGITVRGVDRTLFMTHQDMPDLLGILAHGMVQGQDRSARQPEDGVDPFQFERFEYDFGACLFQTFPLGSWDRYLAKMDSIRSRPASFSF